MTDVANPEQMLFTSTAQAFLEKEAPLSRVRELHAQDIPFDTGWWGRAAELGWASLLVPEELGGGSPSGDGVTDLALLAELAGHTVAPGPLHPVSIVLAGLVEAPGGHEELIESLVAGQTVASWAAYEPTRPFSALQAVTGLGTTATPTQAGYRIDGVKDRVEAGDHSDTVLVVAACDGQIRQFVVPTAAAGVTVSPQNSVDLVKRYARVQFDGVEVDASAAVGTAEQTPAIIERQRQMALVLQCAEIVGILDTVLTMTNQWLTDRHSFGRPLASYQALKHRAADMKMWFEAARATTAGAVAAVAARSPEAPKLVSVAKAYVAERAPVMLQDCVQLHGGIGVTWEHDLHLYLRRVALYRALYGSPEDHHRAVYALSRKNHAAEEIGA
ncbi:acyl-CoA dehydrogenase family protein [Mycolicibacterium fortuitum]|uniref:acyl-CoA dehydrogenase family protein n=1 Tax=Mycolicibacterium fortuitum TaxID=1766 RepID=UPI0007EA006C|nr:acyl-CoA dehydrogenase family protein [Mycolicibacterium fortuitum]NOQ56942.1 acyl-CoA/acyl-ACP dehydrogenase [Mycolicibacterium fortuitum]OBB20350.1 acyl-CoA dehydrogenase [Mycolicibacterium fortuitum]OBB41310.1 acyl-CoA dehydrogenase [Mycolicibacterium fortuitum]OBB68364.1 acyl-CoA dehydrogenase [Mycolicibacterium fortuitum]OBF80286.1 acyl-CoA dehydrogenase [Mycolicibacterium fortuitum]